jgi:D-3-phosphoglycerate dehydrogenase / 2-oxoglutarate reductase
VDNVDFAAAKDLGIPVSNTPQMFGRDVADLAYAYLVALAREFIAIDQGVHAGRWPKPRGISLGGKTLGLIGLGDIGRNLAKRALAAEMNIVAYDPAAKPGEVAGVELSPWPERVGECDFLAVTCSLTPRNRHMVDAAVLASVKPGLRLVNVSRGPLVDEQALVDALRSGRVHSAALEVFETEPLPADSPLRSHERSIFGSHNASNTVDGVRRATQRAIELLFGFLKA